MTDLQIDSRVFVQGTEEWLAFRNSRIGSSDAPCIMGVGFDTPFQRWQQKMGFVKKDISFAMKRGTELEPIARTAFEKEVGIAVFPMVKICAQREWQIASYDGLDFEEKTAVEIKCAGKEDHSLALDGVIPEKYIPQLQHQLLVLNLEKMYYFSFDGSNGKVIEVFRDDDYCKELLDAELKFYDSILNFDPPELTTRDYQKKSGHDWLDMANRWRKIRETIKELEHEEENCRNALLHMADKQSAEGGGIRLQKVYRKGVVDYSKIPELKGVDLERYRKSGSESFRLTVI